MTRLIEVVSFTDVPGGDTVELPHHINLNGTATAPDFVATDVGGFSVSVSASAVTVTNSGEDAATINVWLELKHSIARQLGGGVADLSPRPFIAASGGGGGGSIGGGGTQNKVPLWTPNGTTLGDSPIEVDSEGGAVVVQQTLAVNGNASVNGGSLTATTPEGTGNHILQGQDGGNTCLFRVNSSGTISMAINGNDKFIAQPTGINIPDGIGFFGEGPITAKQSITGATAQDQIDSIVTALVTFGLVTDDR